MRRRSLGELSLSCAFLAPLALFIVVFIFLPVAGTFLSSLFQEAAYLPLKFVAGQNYRRLIQDPGFWGALRFTVLFVMTSVPLEMLCGLATALLLSRPLPWRGLWRAVILIPWAIPAAVSGRVWELIYNFHFGLANLVLLKLRLISQPLNWLGSEAGAFWCLVLTDVWKTTPFVAIILLAGLAAIPEELMRQAEVDRASAWQRWRRVTLPLLKPVLIVALLFRTIDAWRVFDLVFVLTGGGPGGATTSLSFYGNDYFLAGDFGYGSAVSVVLFVIALGLSLIYIRAGRFETEMA